MVAVISIIGAILINRLYHKLIKPVPTYGLQRLGVEWFACWMISMMICASLFY